MKGSDLPEQGIVFWPVGEGDSTTLLVDAETIVQIDINHLEVAESDDDPRYPMVDELVELLPLKNGKPYLAAFVATHADEDHCKGFEELLADHDVVIGELWFTPRLVADIDADDPEELSADATALRVEALRRIEINLPEGATPESGDRIRIVGYHESLEGDFDELDEDLVAVPGHAVDVVDGVDVSSNLRLFVHSPFKDDMESTDRNKTSIGLHITLSTGVRELRALLLGDLPYEPVKQLLEYTEDEENKTWDVLLAPHHCSKYVMYERVDGDDVLRDDVLDLLEASKADKAWIVSSSSPIPVSNKAGDNPPHAKAKNRYLERCDTFVCTGEHPDEENPIPLIFEVTDSGVAFLGSDPDGSSEAAWQIEEARGGTAPAAAAVGFGTC